MTREQFRILVPGQLPADRVVAEAVDSAVVDLVTVTGAIDVAIESVEFTSEPPAGWRVTGWAEYPAAVTA